MLEDSVQQRIDLYDGTLNNVMPIYRWLLADMSIIDLGEDCTEISIKRGFEGLEDIEGLVLPIFKSKQHLVHKERYYSELASSLLLENMGNSAKIMDFAQLSAFGNKISILEEKVRTLKSLT